VERSARYEWVWTETDSAGRVAVALLVAAAGIALSWWMYRDERRRWRPWSVRVALTLRASVWLGLGLLLLGPAWVRVEEREHKPPLVVLRDVSSSMGIVDETLPDNFVAPRTEGASIASSANSVASRRSRADTLQARLQRDTGALWQAMGQRAVPRVADFSASARWLGQSTPGSDWPVDGRDTELGRAIRDALAGEPPAAIVLFTDGQHTGVDDPREAAKAAGDQNVPLLIVGVGESSRPRSSRVAGVYAPPRVWKDEPFEIEAVLAAFDSSATSLRVSLWERRLDGVPASEGNKPSEPVRLESVDIPVAAGTSPQRHLFRVKRGETGPYEYRVRLEPLPGETDLADNEQATPPVIVVEREPLRVLVIAGEPTWEYLQVERWLARDESLRSSCWLQAAEGERPGSGTQPIDRLPQSAEELLEYDVLLLFDPDPTRMGPEWEEWIQRFASEHAGGLLYQPGPRFGAEWNLGPPGLALRDLWPVEFAPAATLEVATRSGPELRGWPVEPPLSERDHPLIRALSAGGGTSPSWDVYWTFPAVRTRPTGRVLLEHSDPATRTADGPRPLLVVGRYGAAQVAYLGFPGMWRAPERAGRDSARGPFWSALIRLLGEGRAAQGRRRGWVQTDRDRIELGETITITARLLDASGAPLTVASVRAVIRPLPVAQTPNTPEPPRSQQPKGHVGTRDPVSATVSETVSEMSGEMIGETIGETVSETLTLTSNADDPGRYEARWTPRREGSFEISVLADANVQAALNTKSAANTKAAANMTEVADATLRTTVIAERPQRETRAPWQDEPLLRDLATLSGGKYFHLSELDSLPAAVPDRREMTVSRLPPSPLWDRGWTLLVFAGMLGGEWWLRKRQHLS
jgi:hypothetical protein